MKYQLWEFSMLEGLPLDRVSDDELHEIDIFEWAGIELTEEEEEVVWGCPIGILEACPSVEFVELKAWEDQPPGHNDVFYAIMVEDEDLLRDEMKTEVRRLLKALETTSWSDLATRR